MKKFWAWKPETSMWVSFSVPWTPHLPHTGSLHIWNYHYLSYRHSIFIKFCTIFLIGYQHSISILCFTIFLVNMTIHEHIMGKLGCLRSFLLWANCHNTNQFFADSRRASGRWRIGDAFSRVIDVVADVDDDVDVEENVDDGWQLSQILATDWNCFVTTWRQLNSL